jgi:hypothetical protein
MSVVVPAGVCGRVRTAVGLPVSGFGCGSGSFARVVHFLVEGLGRYDRAWSAVAVRQEGLAEGGLGRREHRE